MSRTKIILLLMALAIWGLFQTRPILRDINYEFAMASTIWALTAAGIVLALASPLRSKIIYSIMLAAIPYLLSLLLVPFRGVCNLTQGTILYVALPMGTSILVTACATLIYFRWNSPLFRVIAYSGIVIGSLASHLLITLLGPGLFLFEPFFGYFHGPIYDELIPVDCRLLIFRLETMLLVLLMAAVAVLYKRGKLKTAHLAPLLVIVILLPVLVRISFPELGLSTSRGFIQKALRFQQSYGDIEFFINPAETANPERLRFFIHDVLFFQHEIQRILDLPSENKRTKVYVYGSPVLKKKLTGAGQVRIGNFFHKEVHLNHIETFSPVVKHELVHVLAGALGMPFLRGHYIPAIFEGLAVAVTWETDPLNPHQWTRVLRQMNRLPKITSLFSPTGFWSELADTAYLSSGSFIRFLLETEPKSKFHCLYSGGRFDRCYGKTLANAEKEWVAFIDEVTIPPNAANLGADRFSARSVFSKKCPHETARLESCASSAFSQNRPDLGIKLLESAVRKSGCAPDILSRYYFASKLSATSAPPCIPSETPPYLRAETDYLAGRSALALGDRNQAREAFKRASTHPWFKDGAKAWITLIDFGLTTISPAVDIYELLNPVPRPLQKNPDIINIIAKRELDSFEAGPALKSIAKQPPSAALEKLTIQFKASFVVKNVQTAAEFAKASKNPEWMSRVKWFRNATDWFVK